MLGLQTGNRLHLGNLDVRTCFDDMIHALMGGCLELRAVEVWLVRALMKEYVGLVAKGRVVDGAPTELLDFLRGGRQGGVETPAILNDVSSRVRSSKWSLEASWLGLCPLVP